MQSLPIVLDIETEPDLVWIDRTQDEFIASLEPPGNYKKPEAIGKWFEEKMAERKERAALSPLDGRISAFAVGRLWDESAPLAMVFRQDEGRLVHSLLSCIDTLVHHSETPILAGWHINGFDLPFIAARACLHGIHLPDWWPDHPRRYGATLDGAELLQEGRLARWLSRFDLPPKLGDGKDAPNMNDDDLLDYVRQDVVVERELLRRLALVSPTIRRTMPETLTHC